MFTFFANIKDRLTALEEDVKAIYNHIRHTVPNAGSAAADVSAQPATSETVVNESTENGSTNNNG